MVYSLHEAIGANLEAGVDLLFGREASIKLVWPLSKCNFNYFAAILSEEQKAGFLISNSTVVLF